MCVLCAMCCVRTVHDDDSTIVDGRRLVLVVAACVIAGVAIVSGVGDASWWAV
jgi:hypothetical protein